MEVSDLHVVTGAYGYSGKYIAMQLLEKGFRVRTLSNKNPSEDPFNGRVDIKPLAFGSPESLTGSLKGAAVLYNTYWVRFNHGRFSHEMAVENTLALFRAAVKAGVGRIVHVSITNPSEESPFEYFRGKARLEKALTSTGVSHAILRPAVLFGREDILINNIAWMLRRFPFFGLFGDGRYGIQPIYVGDFARLALEAGRGNGNVTVDAVGPEAFSYRELVRVLGEIIGCRRPVIALPPGIGVLAAKAIGLAVGDVVITPYEVRALMSGLLSVDSRPLGTTKLTEWAAAHRDEIGVAYASELARRRVA